MNVYISYISKGNTKIYLGADYYKNLNTLKSNKHNTLHSDANQQYMTDNNDKLVLLLFIKRPHVCAHNFANVT